jgi:23S rRNA G2445 N2-methylase RlmL
VATTRPTPADRYLNLMCGSGTLLIERLARGAPVEAVGVDLAPDALDATRANLRAARYKGLVDLWPTDATALVDVVEPRFDVLVADLPWGSLVGSHEENATLYPAVLAEAARIAVPGARFVVLTHEVRLMARTLRDQTWWRPVSETRVFQKGHHPRLLLLERA